MKISAMPRLAPAGRRSRSRICAWTVTSSAVVGSSAISRRRAVGDRHRDHDALAHAAGELVRIGVEPPLRDRRCRRGGTARAPRRARPRAESRRCARIASATCVADAVHRIEAAHRVLEDHRDARRRAAGAARPRRARSRSAPVEPAAPATTRAAGGSRPMQRVAVSDLPEPLSPTMASVSPRARREARRPRPGG